MLPGEGPLSGRGRGGIVVTGTGSFGAHGAGLEPLLPALAAGAPLRSEIDRSAGYHQRGGARQAALLPPGIVAGWLSPAESRRMSPPSKLAVAAARMAAREAGLEGAMGGGATAISISTAFGPSSYTEGLLRQILQEGPEGASPSLFTESVANAPASQIAIAFKSHGATLTLCQREVGPLLAAAAAAAEIRAGRAERAVAGAVEEMTPLLHAVLDRFGALARPLAGEEGAGEVPRPFDRRRDGLLAAEGATVLLLEREEAALARSAPPLARLIGWGSAFDPTAGAAGWGRGEASLACSLRRVLGRSGLTPEDVDLVVSGASGSRSGDRLEAAALRAAWGSSPLPPVLAPKAVTGEYGGSYLAAALLALRGATFGPLAGFAEPDPELGVAPHGGSPLPPPRIVLVTGLAAGGAAAWLILGRP